ncbi:MAG: hypothetical protein ACM3PU_03175 [Gemmatimonadota bacterium]
MNDMLWSGLLALALMVGGEAASAATYVIVDQTNCDQWSNQNGEVRKERLLAFLSGMNTTWRYVRGDNPLAKLGSAEQAFSWMDSYCKAHPRGTVADGAAYLFFDLVGRKN